MYDSFRLIKQSGLKINYPLALNEGGAKSKLWRQIITDVFNVPTVLVSRRTCAPFGDAILAGVATGIFKDFSVAKQWAEYVEGCDKVKIIRSLNRIVMGWASYYRFVNSYHTFHSLDFYRRRKFLKWYRGKYRLPGRKGTKAGLKWTDKNEPIHF